MSGATVYDFDTEFRRRRGQQSEQRGTVPTITTTSRPRIMHAETIVGYEDDARMQEGDASAEDGEQEMVERPSSELPEWHHEMQRTEDRIERRAAEDRGAMREELRAIRAESRADFADLRSELRSGFTELRQSIDKNSDRLSAQGERLSSIEATLKTNHKWVVGLLGAATVLISVISILASRL